MQLRKVLRQKIQDSQQETNTKTEAFACAFERVLLVSKEASKIVSECSCKRKPGVFTSYSDQETPYEVCFHMIHDYEGAQCPYGTPHKSTLEKHVKGVHKKPKDRVDLCFCQDTPIHDKESNIVG